MQCRLDGNAVQFLKVVEIGLDESDPDDDLLTRDMRLCAGSTRLSREQFVAGTKVRKKRGVRVPIKC